MATIYKLHGVYREHTGQIFMVVVMPSGNTRRVEVGNIEALEVAEHLIGFARVNMAIQAD